MNWSSTGEVENSKVAEEASFGPDHVGQGAVDEARPENYERNEWQRSSSLYSTTNRNSTNRSLEHELELAEEDGRDSADGISKDAPMEGIFQISNDAGAFSVGQRVSNDEPLNRAAGDNQ